MLIVLTIVSGPHFSWGEPTPKPLTLHAALQDKDFYLLSALQADPEVRKVLSQDQALAQVSAEREWFLCARKPARKMHAGYMLSLWTDEEIRGVSFALARIYKESAAVRKLVEKDLRPSGAYVLYEKARRSLLLVNAWQICARGLNDILSVYGEGLRPAIPRSTRSPSM